MAVSLRKEGHQVVLAGSTEDAIARTWAEPPALLVAALELPGEDGLSLVRQLRVRPGWERTPVLLLVRERSLDVLTRGLELGVEEYLTQPVFVRELIARVGLIADREAQRDALDLTAGGRVTGSLMGMALADVLTNLAHQHGTGVLYLEEDDRRGRIYVRDGAPVNARVGDLEGRDALFRAFRWAGGGYTFDPRPVDEPDRIGGTVAGLVGEAVERLDRWERLWSRMPASDPVLETNFSAIAAAGGDLPRDVRTILLLCDGVRRLSRVVDDSPFDDLETIGALERLLARGLVAPAERAPAAAEQRAPSGTGLRAWVHKEGGGEPEWDVDERVETVPEADSGKAPPQRTPAAEPELPVDLEVGYRLGQVGSDRDDYELTQPSIPVPVELEAADLEPSDDRYADELRRVEADARERAAAILKEAEAAREAAGRARREAEEARRRAKEETERRSEARRTPALAAATPPPVVPIEPDEPPAFDDDGPPQARAASLPALDTEEWQIEEATPFPMPLPDVVAVPELEFGPQQDLDLDGGDLGPVPHDRDSVPPPIDDWGDDLGDFDADPLAQDGLDALLDQDDDGETPFPAPGPQEAREPRFDEPAGDPAGGDEGFGGLDDDLGDLLDFDDLAVAPSGVLDDEDVPHDGGAEPSTAPWLPTGEEDEGDEAPGRPDPEDSVTAPRPALREAGADPAPADEDFADTWASLDAVGEVDEAFVGDGGLDDVPNPPAGDRTASDQEDLRTWPSMADIRRERELPSLADAPVAIPGELPSDLRRRAEAEGIPEDEPEHYPKAFYVALALFVALSAVGGGWFIWMRAKRPPDPIPAGGKVAAVAPRVDDPSYPVTPGSLHRAREEAAARAPVEPEQAGESTPAADPPPTREAEEPKEPEIELPKDLPKHPGGRGKGHVALFKQAEKLRKRGKLPEAVEAYVEALALQPGHVPSLLGLGNAYFDIGRPAEALKVLKQAVKAAPDRPEAHLALGMVYQEQNRNDEAARAYRRFLEIAPKHKHAAEVRVVLERLSR